MDLQEKLYFASSRAKALENKLLTKDKKERLADSDDANEKQRILSEAGYDFSDGCETEEALKKMLVGVYSLSNELLGGSDASFVLALRYDCHNIKTAVKCLFCEFDAKSLFIDAGTVKTDGLYEKIKAKDFSDIPKNMAKAAEEAISQYAASRDPQTIDRLIDKACYADMLLCAETCGYEFPLKYTTVLADLANINTVIRAYRMGWNARKVSDFLIEGSVFTAEFLKGTDGSEEKFCEKMKYTQYQTIAQQLLQTDCMTASQIEKILKDYEHTFVKDYAYKNDACANVFSYVIKRENEIKNIRMIFASKAAGLPSSLIKSRLSNGLD